MKTKSYRVLAVLGVVCAGVAGYSIASAKGGAKPLVQIPADALKWEPFFPGGPEEAFVIGSKESKAGPTAFFIKFKGGFDSGWHTHESEYTGIVLAGTILETSKDSEAPKPLTAGSYYVQPSTVHKTVCAAGADCQLYIYEQGKFSFTPTDENGKPLPQKK